MIGVDDAGCTFFGVELPPVLGALLDCVRSFGVTGMLGEELGEDSWDVVNIALPAVLRVRVHSEESDAARDEICVILRAGRWVGRTPVGELGAVGTI